MADADDARSVPAEGSPRRSFENLHLDVALFAGVEARAAPTPRGLGLDLAATVAALLEHFKGRADGEILAMPAAERDAIGAELAEVFAVLVRLADALGVDLVDAAHQLIDALDRARTASTFDGDEIASQPEAEYGDLFPERDVSQQW